MLTILIIAVVILTFWALRTTRTLKALEGILLRETSARRVLETDHHRQQLELDELRTKVATLDGSDDKSTSEARPNDAEPDRDMSLAALQSAQEPAIESPLVDGSIEDPPDAEFEAGDVSQEDPTPAPEDEPIAAAAFATDDDARTPPPPPPAAAQSRPRRQIFEPGWEEKFTSRWLVWLGGLAIALAGFFLIKYSAERGWLSPNLRCAAGVLFGAGLAGAGEWVRRRPTQLKLAAIRPDYVPQALTAAGLFIAFASVYLAYALYGILGPTVTFAALGAIALCGFALSMLQGPYVAALGLAGAMLTPGLISTEAPSAWALFGYLAVITFAGVAILRYRSWWWLGLAAIGMDYFWLSAWVALSLTRGDDIPLFVFVASVSAAFAGLSWLRTQEDEVDILAGGPVISAQACALAATAAGFVLLAVLVHTLDHSDRALAAFALMVFPITLWVKRAPRFELVFTAAAAISIAMSAIWTARYVSFDAMFDSAILNLPATPFDAPNALKLEDRWTYSWFATALSIVFGAGGFWCLRGRRPYLVAAPSILVPLVLLLLGYLRFNAITDDTTWAAVSLAYAGAMALAALKMNSTTLDATMKVIVGLYASAAGVGVSLALAFVLQDAVLTCALAAQVFAIAWLSSRADFRMLRLFTLGLATCVLIRLTFNPFIFNYADDALLGTQWIVYGFGGSALLFYVGAQLFRRSADDELVMALESGALVFAIMLVSYEIRIFIAGSMNATRYELIEQATQSISWLASAYALMRRHEAVPRFFTLWGPRILLALATAQITLLQLAWSNPIVTAKPIVGFFPADVLSLAYLLPGVLIWFAARKFAVIGLAWLRHWGMGAAVLLIVTYSTLEVRHLFQGAVIELQADTLGELYCTTLVWLLIASLPAFVPLLRNELGVRHGALGTLCFAAMTIVAVHGVFENPALTGDAVSGLPGLSVLAIGFAAPAGIYWLMARQSPALQWQQLRDCLAGFACFLAFAFTTLELRHVFQGEFVTLRHATLVELYSTTLAWFVLGGCTFALSYVWPERAVRVGAFAIFGVASLMVLLGHVAVFNPVLTGEPVFGLPIVNLLLLGFILPAALLLIADRYSAKLQLEHFRNYPLAASYFLCPLAVAYFLGFVYVTLEARRWFHAPDLSVGLVSELEDYAYSVTWLAYAFTTLLVGIRFGRSMLRYGALGVLVLTVVKVFMWDMSGLGGLYRVASFLGLGLSLVGIGFLYQRFVYPVAAEGQGNTDSGAQTSSK